MYDWEGQKFGVDVVNSLTPSWLIPSGGLERRKNENGPRAGAHFLPLARRPPQGAFFFFFSYSEFLPLRVVHFRFRVVMGILAKTLTLGWRALLVTRRQSSSNNRACAQ